MTAPALNLSTNAAIILAWFSPTRTLPTLTEWFSPEQHLPGWTGLPWPRFPADEIGYTWNHDNANTYYRPSKLFVRPANGRSSL